VADRLEEIASRAVDLRERDERATEIVSASLAKSERLEIIVKLLRGLLGRARRRCAHGRMLRMLQHDVP
jgi:hypothetical protein